MSDKALWDQYVAAEQTILKLRDALRDRINAGDHDCGSSITGCAACAADEVGLALLRADQPTGVEE